MTNAYIQSLSLPKFDVPLVDKDGRVNRIWMVFLNILYSRVGGALANLVPNYPTQVTTATYTVTQYDTTLIFNPSATCTVTLPVPSNTQNAGGGNSLAQANLPSPILYLVNKSAYAINSAASNVVPLASTSAGTAILSATAGKFAMLQWDGSHWQTIMAN